MQQIHVAGPVTGIERLLNAKRPFVAPARDHRSLAGLGEAQRQRASPAGAELCLNRRHG